MMRTKKEWTLHIFHLLLPVLILAIKQTEILEETLPNAGGHGGGNMIPYFRSVMNLTQRNHIRFAVKAANDAILLFSERQGNTIDYSNDHDYTQVVIGGAGNSWSRIRVGSMSGSSGTISTPGILSNSAFKSFWISWNENIMKVGYGFEIGEDIFIQRSYPSTTDINMLSLFNGFGSGGQWEIYSGIYYH